MDTNKACPSDPNRKSPADPSPAFPFGFETCYDGASLLGRHPNSFEDISMSNAYPRERRLRAILATCAAVLPRFAVAGGLPDADTPIRLSLSSNADGRMEHAQMRGASS